MPATGSTFPSLITSAHTCIPQQRRSDGVRCRWVGSREVKRRVKWGGNYSKITADARRTEVDAKCFTAKGAKSAKIV